MSEEKQERQVQAVMPQARQLAEHAIRHHVITVEDATHPEDFLRPEFYALIAGELRQGDRVEIRDHGMTFWGEYIVTAQDNTWAKVQELRKIKLVPAEVSLISKEFEVKHQGPVKKWCVIRKSDRSSVKESCQTRAEAEQWLLDYERTISRKAA